jgi:phosphatidylserine/phosphatidylglycerophosphate/cardiolipin synthase-like enzyme
MNIRRWPKGLLEGWLKRGRTGASRQAGESLLSPLAWLGAALLASPLPAHADFSVPGFELIQSVPVETSLTRGDARDGLEVWGQLFDGAQREIVLGQMYAVSKAGSPFDEVVRKLEAAGRRGVRIRFIVDQRGVGMSDPATLERLRAIPNLELRVIDYSKRTGGIQHAKYLVVDGQRAYVGSQNFDWRSFTHIHETGLLVTEPAAVAQLQAVFDTDWNPDSAPRTSAAPASGQDASLRWQLLSSPAAFNPAGVADSQAMLPRLLADAKREIRVQLLDYAPLGYGPQGTRPYYGVIDQAVRSAAARGVRVRLMVSHWNTDRARLPYLKSLALLPNVEVRVVTIPRAAEGKIPFARVMHSKTMSIDGEIAWVGTSNWAGGYFDNSRNLEVVLRNANMARRLAESHEALWNSAYAAPLDIARDYPKPDKGTD